MDNPAYYEAYTITDFDPTNMFVQAETVEGESREFVIVIHRDKRTNQLSLDVVPHYVDPNSQAVFSGSEPWPKEELRG